MTIGIVKKQPMVIEIKKKESETLSFLFTINYCAAAVASVSATVSVTDSVPSTDSTAVSSTDIPFLHAKPFRCRKVRGFVPKKRKKHGEKR